MKKTPKRILRIFLLIIILLALAAGAFFLKFYFETKEMTPVETSRINDTVFCIKDKFVNAFVFKTQRGYLMIDAGIDENSFLEGMKILGIATSDVHTLLLTHTDSDHTGAAGLFKNAKIYMHKEEEQMINGENGKFFFIRAKWKYAPYILLQNNDTLSMDGLKIKVFHTPGHTPGSCCFLIGKDYLTTGDNLAYKDGKFSHFNDFFNMDTKQQEISIKRLPNLDSIKYIMTAHYGIIRH
ncbi:MAG: MBL fold metallo-hydrolase [Bacteroidota bacterium]